MRSIDIDWSDWEGEQLEEIDFSCPSCEGEYEGRKTFKQLDNEEQEEIKEVYLKECETKQSEVYQKWDLKDDLKDYYNDNYEGFDFWCDDCTDGRIEPMMNYAYPVNCELNNENAKKALDCGLFLFQHPKDNEIYMSLTGGGMDLSQNILLAYLETTGYIPFEWATDFRQDYRSTISKKDHKRVAKACLLRLQIEKRVIKEKIKAVNLFLKKPKQLKEAQEKRMKQFNDDLGNASKVKDKNIRALVGISALSKATGDIIEVDKGRQTK